VTDVVAVAREDLSFLVSNRIPRQAASRFMGWFSRIEQPWVRDISLALWKRFADLRLDEARKQRFASLHDCFTRELKDGARPVDGRLDVAVSPCDGIVGAGGRIVRGQLLQAKGMPYPLETLLGDAGLADELADGCYVTLRLTSSMYHRFHAPADCTVDSVRYISGDTWNVNPIALARVERLFCRNERAVARLTLRGEPRYTVVLVAVAAILVGSIRIHGLPDVRDRGTRLYEPGTRFERGRELGWFEHGSTIVVLASPGVRLAQELATGAVVRMGQRLLRLPPAFRHEADLQRSCAV